MEPSLFLGLWRLVTDVGTAAAPLLIGLIAASVALAPAAPVIAGLGIAAGVFHAATVAETLEDGSAHHSPDQVLREGAKNRLGIVLTSRTYIRTTSQQHRWFCFERVAGRVLTVRFTVRRERIRIFGAGYWREGRSRYEQAHREGL